VSEKELQDDLAAIARDTRRYLERERAAGSDELLAQSAARAATGVARSSGGGGGAASAQPGAAAKSQADAGRSAGVQPAAAASSPARSAAPAPRVAMPTAPAPSEVDLFGAAIVPPRASAFTDEAPPVREIMAPAGRDRVTLAADALPILDQVAREARACKKCGLCETRTNAVPGVGSAQSGIVFVGEAPGAEEDRRGEPFVGRAGELLTKIIAAMDQKQLIPGVPLSRETVYICNVLKCRPPENRNPLPHEIEMCSPYLHRQLEALKPRVICCLGKFAAELLVGVKGTIGGLRGKIYRYRGAKLIVTYHPAACLRNPAYKTPVWDDMKRLALEYQTD
jgi:uracil-DNA glycosylase